MFPLLRVQLPLYCSFTKEVTMSMRMVPMFGGVVASLVLGLFGLPFLVHLGHGFTCVAGLVIIFMLAIPFTVESAFGRKKVEAPRAEAYCGAYGLLLCLGALLGYLFLVKEALR